MSITREQREALAEQRIKQGLGVYSVEYQEQEVQKILMKKCKRQMKGLGIPELLKLNRIIYDLSIECDQREDAETGPDTFGYLPNIVK